LRAYHNAAQSAPVGDPRRGLRHYGLDLGKGEVRGVNCQKTGDEKEGKAKERTLSSIRSNAVQASSADDLGKGEVRDNVKAGVLEPMVSKVKSLKSALEA
jgi:T-complex protein 1 subunit alpha